ncbi:hypothetical protein [Actinokineospora enzanensis]|uniref:hypothetical protein n=1 Tax=Actinokineospora enzanensis TaxID=155975 RepID=UPI0003603774|nr:hypothetical protein [Actinokineospora enzanensis]
MTNDQLCFALADRHRGQAASLAAGTRPHRDDRAVVELAVATLARNGRRPFCADDVHGLVAHELGGRPYDRNLVSSVMGTAAQRGLIVEDTDIRPVASRNRARHASRNRWWRGQTA